MRYVKNFVIDSISSIEKINV